MTLWAGCLIAGQQAAAQSTGQSPTVGSPKGLICESAAESKCTTDFGSIAGDVHVAGARLGSCCHAGEFNAGLNIDKRELHKFMAYVGEDRKLRAINSVTGAINAESLLRRALRRSYMVYDPYVQ